MASGPQTSTISLSGINAEPPRAAASSPGKAAGNGAPGGGFRTVMEQAHQRQAAPPKNAPPGQQPTAKDNNPAKATGNDLPPDGTALPEQALPDDMETEQWDPDDKTADDKDEADDSAAQAGILLLNPLGAQATLAAAAALKSDGAAPSAVGAIGAGGAARVGAQRAEPGQPQAEGEADVDAGVAAGAGKSAALPDSEAPATGRAKTADQDFNAVLKQLDNAAPNHTTQVAGGRDLATREYQNAAGATTTVQVPVGKPGWSDAVIDKVMWMSSQQLSSADIHLNPPDLGPLQVRISTQHDQASVFFTSQHAAVRDALDHALPKLRDMLDSQGIQLRDAGVGGQPQGSAAQQQQQHWRGDGHVGNGPRAAAGLEDNAAAGAALVAVRLPSSLVDAYA